MPVLFLTTDEQSVFEQFKEHFRMNVLIEELSLTEVEVDILLTIFVKTISSYRLKRDGLFKEQFAEAAKIYLPFKKHKLQVCCDYCTTMFNLQAVKLMSKENLIS